MFQYVIITGKTTLLEHVATLFGISDKDVLSVQVDEQTDSKVISKLLKSAEAGSIFTQIIFLEVMAKILPS